MVELIAMLALIGRFTSMPIAYLVLWFASLASSVTLVVLLRTRWGKSRPLHRCAVLSLLVHLMLAWAAMTMRIVVGGDGDGNDDGMGPAIRVRVIEGAIDGPLVAEAAEAATPVADAPPLLEAPPEEKETPPAEQQAKKDEPVKEPPAEIAAAEPKAKVTSPAEEAVEAPPATDDAPKMADVSAPPAEAKLQSVEQEKTAEFGAEIQAAAVTPETTTAEASATATQPTLVAAQTPTAPQATAPYALRETEGRLGLVEQEGGSGRTESAVTLALRWLANAQSRDGRWDADEYGSGQEQLVLNQNRGGAGRNADTGISALALLAFLGAGQSHMHGDYQDTVRGGIDFLLRSQAADGSLFGDSTLYAQMYCHAMATFALAEAQAMTGDRRFEAAVKRAIDFSVQAQNSSIGGWRYRPGDSGDTSQLGWQLMALASAERAGIDMPSNTWSRVERFLSVVRRGEKGGLASYRPDGPASTSMTAEALYCRLLLADVMGGRADEAACEEATSNLLMSLPTEERINLYYWYYATLALHHRHTQSPRAEDAWRTWNEAMAEVLVSAQVTDGRDAGSWDTNTVWGGYGGRVYTTSMAAMCLEVYYRYAPQAAPRARWTASRSGASEAR